MSTVALTARVSQVVFLVDALLSEIKSLQLTRKLKKVVTPSLLRIRKSAKKLSREQKLKKNDDSRCKRVYEMKSGPLERRWKSG
jgi:hypothetical protein